MLKHICIMTSEVYGVGDTSEAARKEARSVLGKDPHQTDMRTAEVPDVHRLRFRTLPSGIQWTVVPDEQPTAAT